MSLNIERVGMQQLGRYRKGSKLTTLKPGTIRRTIGFITRYRLRMLTYLIVSIIGAAMGVLSPVLAGDVVDVIFAGEDSDAVVRLAIWIAVIAVVEAILNVVSRWQASSLGEATIYDLRRKVFDHVQKMPIAFFTRARTGALVSRLNNDVIGAQTAISRTLPVIVMNVVLVVLTLSIMFTTSWQVTLLALILLPIFLLPTRFLGRKVANLSRDRANRQAVMTDQMTERFSAPGATLVKLFGNPEFESRTFSARADLVRSAGVKIAVLTSVFMTLLTLVSSLALAAVYGFGGVQAITGSLNPGDVVTLALLLTRLYAPLTSLATARVELMSAFVSFERVFEVLDLKPMIAEPEEPKPIPAGGVQLDVDDVSFRYPAASEVSLASLEEVAVLDERAGKDVLHDISFSVKPGHTTALVGSSGAGKSTIASLIARLYDPVSGAVRLNGVDAREVSSEDLHARMGMVTQDAHLFHDTIRENLVMGHVRDDETIWKALERARLTEVVENMPAGLNTVVGERGYRLSGGERQRIAIARLLLAESDLVVLDEATASLDSTSEAHVQQALDSVLTDRTAVVIAHRLSTVRNADEILVVEDGRIIERGTHAELLAADGRYAQLYTTQFAE